MPLGGIKNTSLRWLFGELAVVVIGVFIAFQADNFYQNIKDRSEEQEYLGRLLEDIQSDLAAAESRANTSQVRLEYVELLENSIDSENEVVDNPIRYIKALSEGYYIIGTDVERFTFDELLNTGKLSLIQNPRLRRALLEYYDIDSPREIYQTVREDAAAAFGGILNTKQMFLFGDRMKVEPTIEEALIAREKFIANSAARNSLGRMAEMHLTLISLSSRLHARAVFVENTITPEIR